MTLKLKKVLSFQLLPRSGSRANGGTLTGLTWPNVCYLNLSNLKRNLWHLFFILFYFLFFEPPFSFANSSLMSRFWLHFEHLMKQLAKPTSC